jgi:hypothetical protein
MMPRESGTDALENGGGEDRGLIERPVSDAGIVSPRQLFGAFFSKRRALVPRVI